MKEHEVILKMIEEVAQDDTVKLNEIDARLDCVLFNRPFWGMIGEQTYSTKDNGDTCLWVPPRYTRSRDALKDIRPIGYIVKIEEVYQAFSVVLSKPDSFPYISHYSEYCKTEELSELHAIIQAISYERGYE